jgi:hypothetical protein
LSSCLPLAPLFVAYCFGTLQHKTFKPLPLQGVSKKDVTPYFWLVCFKMWEVKNK